MVNGFFSVNKHIDCKIFMQLSKSQLNELNEWYQSWLDVTKTQIVPQKPNWIK